MAAASYSSDVLQRLDEAIQSLPRPLVPRFDGFQDWLRVWVTAFSETNPNIQYCAKRMQTKFATFRDFSVLFDEI